MVPPASERAGCSGSPSAGPSATREGPTMSSKRWVTSAQEQLSPARRRLLELLRDVHYGRIEQLHVKCGEPVFTPKPRVIKCRKFGPHQHPPRAGHSGQGELKQQARDL